MTYTDAQYVLSGMLNTPSFRDECLESLSINDFDDPLNKSIFMAIKAVAKPGEYLSSIEVAREMGDLPNFRYISDLPLLSSPGTDLKFYRNQFKQNANLGHFRNLMQSTFVDLSKKDADLPQLLNQTIDRLISIQTRHHQTTFQNFEDVLNPDHLDFIKRPTISTGFSHIDAITGGFFPGSLTYLGARTSMGKTTFLLHFLLAAAKQNVKTVFYSFEMFAQVLAQKALCIDAHVSFAKTKEGCPASLLTKLKQSKAKPYFSNINFVTQGMTISELRISIRSFVQNEGVKIIFIDYLTLIAPNMHLSNSHHEVDQISKGLQDIGKELRIPIVCAAQLNRASTNRVVRRPNLSDFRESGSIEEDADSCLLLHRPEYYEKNNKPGITELIIAKNRMYGETKIVEFTYQDDNYEPLGDISISQQELNGYQPEDTTHE